ncbi:hypothetical protein HCJ93_14695 [Streptomyces sp. SBST2-5]|uniref:Uncharacterized protein n=1 Tax=Streptomyces composti TaxID=2720025 RepID=A0ABX1A8E8_9ACTN|nr:hypothetical protein [Streptomyces composti]NJP51287.1 hypothetical protein [Streptomyces composti]
MHTVATVLQWAFLVIGFAVLGAALVSSVRMKLAGAGFGKVVENLEERWFGAGSVLLALLTGTLAMTVAGRLSGHGVGIEQAALVVFPLALVAAFAVRRLSAGGGTGSAGRGTAVRASGLVIAPALLGAVMSAAG